LRLILLSLIYLFIYLFLYKIEVHNNEGSSSQQSEMKIIEKAVSNAIESFIEFHNIETSTGKSLYMGWLELLGSDSNDKVRNYALDLLKNALLRPTKKKKLGDIREKENLATESAIALVVSRAQIVVEPLTKAIGLKACRNLGIRLEEDLIRMFKIDYRGASARGNLLEEIVFLRILQFGLESLKLLPGWPQDIPLEKIPTPNLLLCGADVPQQDLKNEGKFPLMALKPNDNVGADFLYIIGKHPIQSILISFKIRQANDGFDPCVKKEECEKAIRTTDPSKFYHEKKG
jgi:hypothetical protein